MTPQHIKETRNEEVYQMRKDGYKWREIAEHFNFTIARGQQIYDHVLDQKVRQRLKEG